MTSPGPPSVAASDRGLLLGDGLFETLLADCGRLVRFEAHAARLARGCAVLCLPAPDAADLRQAADAALAAAGLARARAALRLTWTAGAGARGLDRPEDLAPRLIATAAPSSRPSGPASLAVVTLRRNPTSPTSRLKTLSYLDNVLARREAVAVGADEALMLNTAGEVACAAAANLFWIREGRLFTPALDCGALDGIVRAAVLEQAAALGVEAVETHAGLEAVSGADAVFLTNSLIGMRQVSRLGAAVYGPDSLADRLSDDLALD